jgi:hypothetical protein
MVKERALKDVLLSLDYAAKKSLRTSHYCLPFLLSREEGVASANIAKIIALKTVIPGERGSRERKRRE